MDSPTRLYLLTPPVIDLATFPDAFKRACDGGDVAVLQLRLKTPAADGSLTAPPIEDDIRRAAEVLLPLCQTRDIPLILNDSPALARELGLQGVHLGGNDMPLKEARKLLGEDMVIGVSCYNSRDRAMTAANQGADYVAFGTFFPSQSKNSQAPGEARPTTALLSWWHHFIHVPSVAIGGITPENCRPLVEAGADFIACINAVWKNPAGPQAAVAAFNRVFQETEVAPLDFAAEL